MLNNLLNKETEDKKDTIKKNNWIYFGLIVVLISVITIKLSGYLKAGEYTVLDESIVNSTEQFITYLFENETDKAGELALGTVRFNVLSNQVEKVETENNFSIENITSSVSFSSANLATVNSVIEYMNNINSENDTVFYEVKLLKENNEWKVFNLNEEDPSFNNMNSNNDNTNSNFIDIEDVKEVFTGYARTLSNGEYEKSSQFLIGRAKKMHKKSNTALKELDLVSKITELESKVVYGEENNVVAEFNYKNNDRPVSVLVYFHLTKQGWRIYNVNQI